MTTNDKPNRDLYQIYNTTTVNDRTSKKWTQPTLHNGIPATSAYTHTNIAPNGNPQILRKTVMVYAERYSRTYNEHTTTTSKPHTKLKQ